MTIQSDKKEYVYDDKYNAWIRVTRNEEGKITNTGSFIELLRYPSNEYKRFNCNEILSIVKTSDDLLLLTLIDGEKYTIKGYLEEILTELNRWSK